MKPDVKKIQLDAFFELHITKRMNMEIKLDDNTDQTGWFDMPYEMREIVIDYMDLPTKIKFSQCSKLCFEEAQLLNLCFNSIHITDNPYHEKKGVVFEMWSDVEADDDESGEEMILTKFLICDIRNISEGELMNLRSRHGDQLIEVETSEEVTEYLMYLLRGFLKVLQNSLVDLSISIHDFPYNKMKIENNLKCLEFIRLSQNNQFDPIRCGFIDFEQLCSIKHTVVIPNLTIDQMFQLKAKEITAKVISLGNDNEQFDIEQIVNRLFSDEIDDNVTHISFRPKQDLENTPGIYAKRVTRFAVDYLFKQMDKMIKITPARSGPAEVTIALKVSKGFKESEWTIL